MAWRFCEFSKESISLFKILPLFIFPHVQHKGINDVYFAPEYYPNIFVLKELKGQEQRESQFVNEKHG